MKPLLVFDGNCQSHHLAAIFQWSGLAEAYVNGRDYGTVPAFRGRLCRYADEATCAALVGAVRQAGGVAVQVSQSTPMAEVPQFSYSGLVDRVVRFPYLLFSAVNVAAGGGAGPRPRRSYQADLQIMRLCQDKVAASIDVVDFIEREHARKPLFHMHVHPGPDLTSLLFSVIAEQLADVVAGDPAPIAREIAAGEGINIFTQHPVPGTLLEDLGFQWPASYEAYAAMIAASRTADWAVLDGRRDEFEALFEHDTQFWLAYFNTALARGQLADASAAFDRLVAMSPGYVGIWYAMYAHGGKRDQTVDRFRQLFQGQRQASHFLARVAIDEGRLDDGVAQATEYRDSARDLADGFVPLVLALEAAGRLDQAKDEAIEFFEAMPAHRRQEVAAAIERFPQLALDPATLDLDAAERVPRSG